MVKNDFYKNSPKQFNNLPIIPVATFISSIYQSELIQGFKKSMRSNWSFSIRLDEMPCFIVWPLVYLIGKTRITPNQVALVSFCCGIAFLYGLVSGLLPVYPLPLFFLLTARILLDCVDGQLARYTDQTSNLGALYDLASDFAFAVALFTCLAYVLIVHEKTPYNTVMPVVLMALICFLLSSTAFSYLGSLLKNSDMYPVQVREKFVAALENDRPQSRVYAVKLSIFNFIFRWTWRLVSYPSFFLIVSPEKTDYHASGLRILAPLEYGMHLAVLAVMILLRVNLVYYLIFEITAFFALNLLLLYHYRA